MTILGEHTVAHPSDDWTIRENLWGVLAFMEQMQLHRLSQRAARDHRSSRIRSLKAWSVTLTVLATTCSALACSGVGPPGKPVVFGDQTNIVIWDEEHQTEHFIWNANFRSGATNFGFIAPTPRKPELSEASSKAFHTLASLAPVVGYGRGGLGGGGFGGGSRSAEVRVIQEADVADYHAATLWSRSAGAIKRLDE